MALALPQDQQKLEACANEVKFRPDETGGEKHLRASDTVQMAHKCSFRILSHDQVRS